MEDFSLRVVISRQKNNYPAKQQASEAGSGGVSVRGGRIDVEGF